MEKKGDGTEEERIEDRGEGRGRREARKEERESNQVQQISVTTKSGKVHEGSLSCSVCFHMFKNFCTTIKYSMEETMSIANAKSHFEL